MPTKIASKLIKESLKIKGKYNNDITTIKINNEIIHCTRMSKQLLKLKPEIQDKVVKWFYDIVISKFDKILKKFLI